MTFQVAVIASGVGEVSRIADDLPHVRRMVRKLTLLTGGAAFLNGAVLSSLPDRVGEAVLGDTWTAAQHLMWPAAAQILVLGLMTGFRTGMLGMRAIDKAVKIDVVTTVLALILSSAVRSPAGPNPRCGAQWSPAPSGWSCGSWCSSATRPGTCRRPRSPQPERCGDRRT